MISKNTVVILKWSGW